VGLRPPNSSWIVIQSRPLAEKRVEVVRVAIINRRLRGAVYIGVIDALLIPRRQFIAGLRILYRRRKGVCSTFYGRVCGISRESRLDIIYVYHLMPKANLEEITVIFVRC